MFTFEDYCEYYVDIDYFFGVNKYSPRDAALHAWNFRSAEVRDLQEHISFMKRRIKEALFVLDHQDTTVAEGQDILESILKGEEEC